MGSRLKLRRQETGDRRQETGDSSQETGKARFARSPQEVRTSCHVVPIDTVQTPVRSVRSLSGSGGAELETG